MVSVRAILVLRDQGDEDGVYPGFPKSLSPTETLRQAGQFRSHVGEPFRPFDECHAGRGRVKSGVLHLVAEFRRIGIVGHTIMRVRDPMRRHDRQPNDDRENP